MPDLSLFGMSKTKKWVIPNPYKHLELGKLNSSQAQSEP